MKNHGPNPRTSAVRSNPIWPNPRIWSTHADLYPLVTVAEPDINDPSDIRVDDIAGPARFGRAHGVVEVYDSDRGVGIARSQGDQWIFHCTAIAGGSRSIEAGAEVSFEVRPGGPGRFEAFDVTQLR